MNPLTYALLAQKAYSVPAMIGEQDSAARAIFEETDDGLAFALPGTNNVACMLADLDFRVQPVTGLGGLHAGFWEAYLEIRQPLWDQVAKTNKPIITTGHSEGADLALIFGGYLCLFGRPPKAIFAFEPAHVSIDDTLATLFETNGVQVLITRKGNDLVPIVPRLFQSWRHPGPVTPIGKPLRPFDNIEDHAMDGVVEVYLQAAHQA